MQIPISALVLCLGHLAMSAVIPDSVAKIEAKSLNVERELETRGQKGGVYLCNDVNWGGACIKQNPNFFACNNLPDGFWDQLSSVGPDKGTKCTLFDNNFCQTNQGQLDDIRYPGIADLRQQGWNDRAASYICYPN